MRDATLRGRVAFVAGGAVASPDYGSGASIGGVGPVLVLGLGLILSGIVFTLVQRARDSAYFRGEPLVKDTPALVVEEP